jgi:hypothetical protein
MSDLHPQRRAKPGGGEGGDVISETRAKQGTVGLPVVAVLVVSSLLAAAALFGAWFIHAAGKTQDQGESGAPPAAARSFHEPLSSPKQAPNAGRSP